jgi:hypothetical protein
MAHLSNPNDNRRVASRLPVEAGKVVELLIAGTRFEGRVLDVSTSGMRFSLINEAKVDVGEQLSLMVGSDVWVVDVRRVIQGETDQQIGVLLHECHGEDVEIQVRRTLRGARVEPRTAELEFTRCSSDDRWRDRLCPRRLLRAWQRPPASRKLGPGELGKI